ncbi:hypothetical protein GCM10009647_080450 [Streptomyces sanglieri]
MGDHELQGQTTHKAELAGIAVETVEPSYTSNNARSVAVRSKKIMTANRSPVSAVRTR